MGLLSIFRKKASEPSKKAPAASGPDTVQQARTRARRRLVGAFVLVALGVIGFPLLFETQPRPIPVDIPIDIPKKDGAPPLTMPAAPRTRPVAVLPVEPAASAAPEVTTETRAEAGRELPAAPVKPASHAAAAAPKPAEPVVAKPASAAAPPAAAAAKPPHTASANDAARAQALLEGKAAEAKPAAPKDGARYVVQVGAFTDSAAARDTRAKIEKLGLKTYTQVAETPSGSRIRVRVGPFASRDEADRAMAKAKAAGVAAVVLTL